MSLLFRMALAAGCAASGLFAILKLEDSTPKACNDNKPLKSRGVI